MTHARFTVTLPGGIWIGELSRRHPDATFRVLAALPDEGIGVGLLEITAPTLAEVVAEMDAAEGITALDLLRVSGDEALVQFETTQPALLVSIQHSKVPLEPPVIIRNGRATFSTHAPRERLRDLEVQLAGLATDVEVEYLRAVDPTDRLTEPQRRVLTAAVTGGYYEFPRECTLTELASRLGLSKSTTSKHLRRAERAVLSRFVEESRDSD